MTSGQTLPSSPAISTGQHWIVPTSAPSSTAAKLSSGIALDALAQAIRRLGVPVAAERAVQQRLDGGGIDGRERHEFEHFGSSESGDDRGAAL